MALSFQDFVKGVDFSALVEVTGADLNNHVELAVPVDDLNGDGKGLILCTTDAIVDTPTVPDPTQAGGEKWVRYLWLRKPHANATNTTPLVYGWDDNATADNTYAKWVRLYPDIDTFNDSIASLQTQITAVGALANTANINANAANTVATTANNTSNAALAQVSTASQTAAEAVTLANEVATDLTSLETQVSEVATAAAAKKPVNSAILPGTLGGQEIRTLSDASGVEWYNPKDTVIVLEERFAKNTNAGGASAGQNVRDMNTEVYNNGVSVLNGPAPTKFTLPAGTYYARIVVPGYGDSNAHQAFLLKDEDSSIILQGTSTYLAGNSQTAISLIEGIFTLASATKLKISDYWTGNEATTGLGRAANVAPAGGTEVYTRAIFQRIQ